MAAYRPTSLLRVLIAVFAMVGGVGSASAAAPSLLWSGASEIGIRCMVQSSGAIDTSALELQLCARVRDLAARGAPMAVKLSPAGSAALVKADTVTLAVHASVDVVAGRRMVIFTIRPVRPSLDATEILFGTPPRAVAIGPATLSGPLIDSQLRAALAEVLPWQARRDDVRPIRKPK